VDSSAIKLDADRERAIKERLQPKHEASNLSFINRAYMMTTENRIDLQAIEFSAQRLKRHLASMNFDGDKFDADQIKRFADISIEVCQSESSDLRDNLISAYSLSQRPKISDEDIDHSNLLLDKYINDLRDALLNAEQAASEIGLPTNSQPLSVPTPILVPIGRFPDEIKQLRASHNEIKAELDLIKVSGNQLGIFNFKVETIEIKVDIASAMLAFKQFIDAANLSRTFSGISSNVDKLIGWSIDNTGPAVESIAAGARKIKNYAQVAIASIKLMIKKIGKSDRGDQEIWSEVEALNLLREGKTIPEEAIPFIRHANLNYGYKCKIDDISKLSELRTLEYSAYSGEEKNLYKLSSLKKLRTLKLSVSRGCDLSWVNDLRELEKLNLSGPYNSERPICFLGNEFLGEKLQSITINNMTVDKIPSFSSLPGLRNLDIDGLVSDDFSSIATAKNITHLSAIASDLSNIDFITSLTELEDLDIRDIPGVSLAPARSAISLKTLRISRRYIHNYNLNDVRLSVNIYGDHGGTIRKSKR